MYEERTTRERKKEKAKKNTCEIKYERNGNSPDDK